MPFVNWILQFEEKDRQTVKGLRMTVKGAGFRAQGVGRRGWPFLIMNFKFLILNYIVRVGGVRCEEERSDPGHWA